MNSWIKEPGAQSFRNSPYINGGKNGGYRRKTVQMKRAPKQKWKTSYFVDGQRTRKRGRRHTRKRGRRRTRNVRERG